MHMHEKNGAFVVQDTSTGHLNLSCAVLSLDSSVFIFWNRYCTYTAHGFHARLFAVIHALEESLDASFAPQLLAACLAQGSSCSSRDHTTLTRQTQVLLSCCL